MRITLKFIAAAACLSAFFVATPTFCESVSAEKSLSYKFAQYFTNKDLEGMASILNDQVTVYDPGKITTGKEHFLKLLKSNFDKTNVISFRILHMYQQDNTTVFEYKLSFDKDTYNGVDVIVFENNKIKEIRCYYNPPGKLTAIK